MGELRKIPITLKNDHEKVIGYMMFDDTVSDEEIVNSSFSWGYYTSTKRIMEAALVPNPKAVPLTVEIEGVKRVVGSALMEGDGSVTGVVTDDEMQKKLKFRGPFSMGE